MPTTRGTNFFLADPNLDWAPVAVETLAPDGSC
jgi:hypothetical protein